jgi:hypothetical protein
MNKRSAAKASFGTKANEAAARGRSIQASVDRLEAGKKKQKSEDAMQAGQRHCDGAFRAAPATLGYCRRPAVNR